MERLLIAVVFLAVFVVGFIHLFRSKTVISEELKLAQDFLEKLRGYIDSRGEDAEAYIWMVHRSDKMQTQLGSGGIFAAYRPPFANYQYKHYPVVLNMLPDLRNALAERFGGGSDLANQYGATLGDTLVRHVGVLDDRGADMAKLLRNPIIWFREGVRILIGLPVSLLGWLGILSVWSVSRIIGGQVFGLLSGLVGLIGFISAIMGIILGWNEFVRIALSLWPSLSLLLPNS